MKAILLPTKKGVRFWARKVSYSRKVDFKSKNSILRIVFSTLNDLIRTHLMLLSVWNQKRTKVEKTIFDKPKNNLLLQKVRYKTLHNTF